MQRDQRGMRVSNLLGPGDAFPVLRVALPGGRQYHVYHCLTRVCDLTACEQRPMPREAVDEAALRALGARGVSVDQARAEIAEARALEQRTVVARLADAQREKRRAADRLARIDRDYADAAPSPASYERLHAMLSGELEGATAARDQAAAHAEELRAAAATADDTLMSDLVALRYAIADHLRDGANVDEVRFLLRRLFARFTVREVDGGVAVVPELRPQAVDELMAGDRAPLRLTTNANGLPTAWFRRDLARRQGQQERRSPASVLRFTLDGDRLLRWRQSSRTYLTPPERPAAT
jgi:hypothetical protein